MLVPTAMRAVVYSQTGNSNVLLVVERPKAEPGPGEVRVRIVASGVNPTDWKARSGAGTLGASPFAEVVPNQDGAGVVDAVGPGVTGLAAGDRVWVYLAAHGRPTGTAQEFTVLPAGRVFPLPDNASFDVGASLGVPAMTAHRALTVSERGPARLSSGSMAGQTVLVAGGAGAVGHAAIQLAKWAGATVITTISGPFKGELAAAAGADHIINYTKPGVVEAIRRHAPHGVDVIVEVSPAVNSELDRAVIANGGVISIYATDGGSEMTVDVAKTFALNVRYQFLLLYTVDPTAMVAAGDDITAALRDGALPVGEAAGLPLVRFTLERVAEAHDAVQGGVIGKVLIDVS